MEGERRDRNVEREREREIQTEREIESWRVMNESGKRGRESCIEKCYFREEKKLSQMH